LKKLKVPKETKIIYRKNLILLKSKTPEVVVMSRVIKIGVLKSGCIGTLPILEFLLDERAERTDIDLRVAGSGSKLGVEQCKEITSSIIQQKPDLVLFIAPGQQTQGPTDTRNTLAKIGLPTIIVSDGPAKKMVKEIEEAGLGYIIILADSMIGARRELLDPTEMAIYNADILKVLAGTGVLNVVVREIDRVIWSFKREEKPNLPRIIIDKNMAVEAAGFENPYAKAKATAAYEISRHVAELNSEGCFKVKEWKKYVPLIAAGHEMMRIAAKLIDEAREIEKSEDYILRKPHYKDGSLRIKRALVEKLKKWDYAHAF
jgi:methylenetetrahydromethanopterin dehydrogenase